MLVSSEKKSTPLVLFSNLGRAELGLQEGPLKSFLYRYSSNIFKETDL